MTGSELFAGAFITGLGGGGVAAAGWTTGIGVAGKGLCCGLLWPFIIGVLLIGTGEPCVFIGVSCGLGCGWCGGPIGIGGYWV